MKEVTCKLYTFEELSEEVRKEIVDKKRWDVMASVMDGWSKEYQDSLNKFCEMTGFKAYDWSVDYCSYYFRFRETDDYVIGCYEYPIYPEDCKGKLLRRWIDHFWNLVLDGKTYWKGCDKRRVSRFQKEKWDDCVLTGVCFDNSLLEPIAKAWEKLPRPEYTLEDLIHDCFENFFKAWHKDYEHWADDDGDIEDELCIWYEDDLFFANGTKFEGTYEEPNEEAA